MDAFPVARMWAQSDDEGANGWGPRLPEDVGLCVASGCDVKVLSEAY